jgi:hypothetical protein
MAAVNTGRVVLAGLVAGFVLNLGDMVGGMALFENDMKAMVDRLHLDPGLHDMTAANIVPWVAVDFIFGIIIMFTYAGIRPRFGPGPKTALVAGGIIYATLTTMMYALTSMGIFDPAVFPAHAAFHLVNTAIASLAGGWAYKE